MLSKIFFYCLFVVILVPQKGVFQRARFMRNNNSAIEFDGKKYNDSDFTDVAKELLKNITRVNAATQEKNNIVAILTKAKKAYIAELKSEMLSAKSGFNFSD